LSNNCNKVDAMLKMFGTKTAPIFQMLRCTHIKSENFTKQSWSDALSVADNDSCCHND